jgi:dolichol-phosphate mannosyltransferase
VKLSVVIPAHNEEGCIKETVDELVLALNKNQISHEILVVNDNSKDQTENILISLKSLYPSVQFVNNVPPHGFGFAVRKGLEQFSGDCVAVYMADASDSPSDLVSFFRTMVEKKVDCVFGTRWSKGGKTFDYPWIKKVLNRMANSLIQVLFGLKYDDTTNAFKLYRREVIMGVKPFLSHHFNLTVEIPLKAIVRGYSYKVLPNSWTNRKSGVSKLKIREMGSRYLFIILYCLIEKWLSRGDYRKP